MALVPFNDLMSRAKRVAMRWVILRAGTWNPFKPLPMPQNPCDPQSFWVSVGSICLILHEHSQGEVECLCGVRT